MDNLQDLTLKNANSANFIEIIGSFTSDATLTLNAGSTGGLRFNGGSVNLTSSGFSVNTPVFIGDNGNTVEPGPNSRGTIKANTITINNTVKATTNGANDLSLEANTATGTIKIIGAVGETGKILGNILVKTGAADFDAAVTAKSYTQDAGSANFDGAQNYSGANGAGYGFQFDGTTLRAGGTVTVTEDIKIENGTADFDQAVTAKSYTQDAGAANFDTTQNYGANSAGFGFQFNGTTLTSKGTVTSAGDIYIVTGAADFDAAVTARSYAQDAGSANFDGAQTYDANSAGYGFKFAGTTLTVNNSLTTSAAANSSAGGKILIEAGADFITSTSGTINSGGTFEKTGAGTSGLGADIVTTNAAAASASITFNDAPIIAGLTDSAALTLDSAAGSGAINIAGTVSSGGTERSLVLASGGGTVTLSNTGAPAINLSGSFSKTGDGQSRLSGGITTADKDISFAFGPVVLYNDITLNSGIGAGSITLGAGIAGDAAGRDLTLNPGVGIISVTGNVGSQGIRLGDIVADSSSTDAPGLSFNGAANAIYAESYTQTGTASTAIYPAQDYSGGFSFTGTNLLVDNTLSAGGALEITSAADVKFGDTKTGAAAAIAAERFTQSAGTITVFNGTQNYARGFSFTGDALEVNDILNTDTGTGDDGAIVISAALLADTAFTIGENGVISAGGTTNATVTITGNTTNNGTINAGEVPAANAAIIFDGNYVTGASGPRIINGNAASNPDIVFKGEFAALRNISPDNDRIVFDTGTWTASGPGTQAVHTLSQSDDAGLVDFAVHRAIGPALIRAGNTVTLGTDISQDSAPANPSAVPSAPARSLELAEETAPGAGDGGKLNTAAYTWRMGAVSNPAAGFTPAFDRGFYGFHGELTMNSGSRLETVDFYTEMSNGNAPAHEHSVSFSAGPGAMSDIVASGNVWINESFVNPEQSRLTMTGNKDISVRTHDNAGKIEVDAEIGHFSVGEDSFDTAVVTIGSDLAFRGSLTIRPGRTFIAGAASASAYRIRVEGDWIQWTGNVTTNDIPPLADYNANMGTFIPRRGTVEFGKQGGRISASRTFRIIGNTTWYNFACNEPGAKLLFSNYPHNHIVTSKFSVFPTNASGDLWEDAAHMIALDRLIEVRNPSPPALTPPVPDFVPAVVGDPWVAPLNVTKYFWFFDLESQGELDMNYTSIFFSFASRRMPLPPPPVTSWRIDASPYVEMTAVVPPATGYVPNYTPGVVGSPMESGSYYNVNWYVANQFFYAFTEDFDGNGRIDRLRLQSAFELLDYYPSNDARFPNQDAFKGFEVEVEGYQIDRSKGRNGYARADMGTNAPDKLDCIFIFLKELDHNDGGERPRWKITNNEFLRDLTTRSVLVGEAGDEGVPWDTTPPRINYALTIPGSDKKEIFFQMSEAVNAASLVLLDPADTLGLRSFGSLKPLDSAGGGAGEFLIPLSDSYGVADLAAPESTFPRFVLNNVQDLALVAGDLHFSNVAYSYRHPSPRYPYNFNYDAYVFVENGSPIATWAKKTGDASPAYLNTVVCGEYAPLPSKPEAYTPNKYANRLNGPRFDSSRPVGQGAHRVTDAYISVPPLNASDTDKLFIWPVWARYKTPSNPANLSPGSRGEQDTDVGIIWDFTGIKFLEERDTVLQARLNTNLSGDPELFLGLGIGADYRNPREIKNRAKGTGGLWLPAEADSSSPSAPVNYINLVPRWTGAGRKAPLSLSQQPHFNYEFSKDIPGYDSGAKVDFLFRLNNTPQDIFAGRLELAPGVSSVPANWYRLVRPFSFDLQNVTLQRGGVTVLNNVINPNDGESAYIRYHLLKSGRVTVQVFTLDGTLVRVLRRNDHREAGEWTDAWNGKNNGGRAVARGMYFVRVVGPDIDEIRKIMVVK
ncbi:MAG: hypothetical protein LBS57_09530 [Treponema sp.]|nr:hypothetical protein [Treponema sp.]